MGSLFCLAQSELSSSDDDVDLVGYPMGDEAINRQRPRDSIDKRQHVCTEVVLQLGVLIKVIQYNPCNCVAL